MGIGYREINPGFGAEVAGMGLARPFTPEEEADLVALVARYGVCVFRDTGLTDATHIWFSRMFGNLWTVPGKSRFAFPQLFEAGNLTAEGTISTDEMARSRRRGDRLWHTDSSFTQARTTYSLLLAHEVPDAGGATCFADARGAWEALPPAMQQRIEGLRAEHSYFWSRRQAGYPVTPEQIANGPKATHPLVHVHPGSGRKSLYIAAHAMRIVGLDDAEGQALIAELLAFATQPQFTFTHHWRPGDLVIWDNFATLHRGADYDDATQRRDLRRTTVFAWPPPPVVLDPRFADRFDPEQFRAMVQA